MIDLAGGLENWPIEFDGRDLRRIVKPDDGRRGKVRRLDITGRRYGRLVAIRYIENKPAAIWEFQCDCGRVHRARLVHVRAGRTRSCGCLTQELRNESRRARKAMRCEECAGQGKVMIDSAGNIVRRLADAVLIMPCPGCGGCGQAHCCEGERPGNVLPENWLPGVSR